MSNLINVGLRIRHHKRRSGVMVSYSDGENVVHDFLPYNTESLKRVSEQMKALREIVTLLADEQTK
jgi:hypothetical protein